MARIFANTAVMLPPLILGVLLAASNWRLVGENRRLSQLAQHYASLQHTREGMTLPDLQGKGLDGRDLTIPSSSGRKTLLFVFSPTCPHCKRTWPAWLDLARHATRARIVFVNVGGPIPPDFSRIYSFDSAAVMADTSPGSILKYSLLETPLTILVSADGHAEKVSAGELAPSDVSRIEGKLAEGLSTRD